MPDHIFRPAGLHEFSFFHHRNLIAEPTDHIEIVGDKQVAETQFFLELLLECHDLCLYGDVEHTRWLV